MHTPEYINREMGLINPLYFVVFNPHIAKREGRWQVRKWDSHFARTDRNRCWQLNSLPILTIRKEGESGGDAGYHPLDMRAVHAVKAGLAAARRAKEIALEVDAHNERLRQYWEDEEEYIYRYAAKTMWHHFREPTVILGG